MKGKALPLEPEIGLRLQLAVQRFGLDVFEGELLAYRVAEIAPESLESAGLELRGMGSSSRTVESSM